MEAHATAKQVMRRLESEASQLDVRFNAGAKARGH